MSRSPQAQPADVQHQRFRMTNGRDIPLGEGSREISSRRLPVTKVAILGSDFPGDRFELMVSEGDRVAKNSVLLQSRHQSRIKFCTPAGGTVCAIRRGARRALMSVEIEVDQSAPTAQFAIPGKAGRENLRNLMLDSGIWTSLRRRPYGCIPDPERDPQGLLITAIDSQPLAPDPAVIIARYQACFDKGVEALATLVSCPLYLCQRPGNTVTSIRADNLVICEFTGPHPAGLPGTHINRLCAVGHGKHEAWHIDYQSVIALGHLLLEGVPWDERVISMAGPAIDRAELVTVTAGAWIHDLVNAACPDFRGQILPGSALNARLNPGGNAYLGHWQRQLTFLPAASPAVEPSQPGPMLPLTTLENLLPPAFLTVPLLRALLNGDYEQALALGALELVEEDMALVSAACSSGADYGALLRPMLDQHRQENREN